MKNWDEFRQTKAYDFIAGLPLILWFGYGAMKLRPDLAADALAILSRPDHLIFYLRFFARFAAASFNLLLIYLVVVRNRPVRRAAGFPPHFFGFAGTFLGVAILSLRPLDLSLAWQSIAAFLVFLGSLGSAIVLAQLGKAFSIMPEARLLVTKGPYAWARHPLYVMEFITLLGTAMQFSQPWAAFLAIGVMICQVVRTIFEERVLAETYPDYMKYQARVKRFGVI